MNANEAAMYNDYSVLSYDEVNSTRRLQTASAISAERFCVLYVITLFVPCKLGIKYHFAQ